MDDRRIIEESLHHERRNIMEQCHRRMKLGEMNYGDKDVAKSEVNFLARDIFRDYEEETLDRINYKKMLIVGVRYGRLSSKPRDFAAWFAGEMQRLDEEMFEYVPPDKDTTWDYESYLLYSIDRDIKEHINMKILKGTDERVADAD